MLLNQFFACLFNPLLTPRIKVKWSQCYTNLCKHYHHILILTGNNGNHRIQQYLHNGCWPDIGEDLPRTHLNLKEITRLQTTKRRFTATFFFRLRVRPIIKAIPHIFLRKGSFYVPAQTYLNICCRYKSILWYGHSCNYRSPRYWHNWYWDGTRAVQGCIHRCLNKYKWISISTCHLWELLCSLFSLY